MRQTGTLGRWFSWSPWAHTYLDDFSVWKMSLEDCVKRVKDPDDDDIGFGDLKKAAKRTTPFESLNKLREQGADDDDDGDTYCKGLQELE